MSGKKQNNDFYYSQKIMKIDGMETSDTPGNEDISLKDGLKNKEMAPAFNAESYFKRLVDHSLDNNLKLSIRSSEALKKGKLSAKKGKAGFLEKKLPAARESRRARKAEEAALDNAKQIFRNADLCTVREKAALEKYYGVKKNNYSVPEGDDSAGNPSLTEYVNSILSMELNSSLFTDDYLSDHLVRLLEYTDKLRNYSHLRQQYPRFFEALSEEKRVLLDTRAAAAIDLGRVLKKHHELHGIVIDRTEKGYTVRLTGESTDKNARNAERNRRKQDYETSLEAFLRGRVYADEVNLARSYTRDDLYTSDKEAADLEASLSGFTKAWETCGEELIIASDEMKSAWKIRDQIFTNQKELIRSFDAEKNEAAKENIKVRISRNNRRIRIVNAHVEHYRDLISLITGQTTMIKADTARYLEAENRQELLDIVRIKTMGDCLEKAFVANRNLEEHKPEKQAQKYSGALMPLDMFYERISEYKALKVKATLYNEMKEKTEAKGSGEKISVTEAFHLLTDHTPDKGTSVKTRESTVKAAGALLDEILSVTPEKLAAMKDQDMESPQFWHDRALLMVSQDMEKLLTALKNWDIPVTDEQYAHLAAFGMAGKLLYSHYRALEEELSDPMRVMVKDKRLTGDTLQSICTNIFEPYCNGSAPKDAEVSFQLAVYLLAPEYFHYVEKKLPSV